MQSQKSDPLAFGRVYEGVMAARRGSAPAAPQPAGAAGLAAMLGLVPADAQDAGSPAELIKGGDGD